MEVDFTLPLSVEKDKKFPLLADGKKRMRGNVKGKEMKIKRKSQGRIMVTTIRGNSGRWQIQE
jgi:hypothetical protein